MSEKEWNGKIIETRLLKHAVIVERKAIVN
jgi:hypothetical protein